MVSQTSVETSRKGSEDRAFKYSFGAVPCKRDPSKALSMRLMPLMIRILHLELPKVLN